MFDFPDGVGREETGEVGERIDDAAAADERAGVDDGVAADLGVVADDGAKFFQAGGDAFVAGGDEDFAAIKAHVGKDDAGAEVGLVAEDGIAHVVEVRDFAVVEEDAVLKFAGIAEDAVVTDDHVFANVAAAANLAVFADPGRSLDDSAWFHDGAFTDEDVIAHGGLGMDFGMEGGLEVGLKIF